MITAARTSQAICQYAAETVLLSLNESIRKLTEI